MLKRMLLIFDHIHIIDPNENNFLIPRDICKVKYGRMEISMTEYGVLYNGDLYKSIEEKLIDEFDYAYNKGILRVENLKYSKFYEKFWLSLRLSYEFDTANEKLLLATKGLLEGNSQYEYKSGILRGFFVQPSGVKIYPDIPPSPNVFKGKNEQLYELQAFSAIAKMDRSLLLAGLLDLIPTFVDDNVAKLFIEKSNFVKNNSDKDMIAKFFVKNKVELQNVQHLLYNISQAILPDEILEEIPIKELIIARNNTFQQLYKLRRKLLNSIEFLATEKYDEKFIQEAQVYIEKKLKPQLEDYSSNWIKILPKFIHYGSTLAFGSVGAMIGLNQSLNPLQIALFSGITATVGNVTSNLADYMANQGKSKFNNTYSYFLNFRE
jgi:hypothetical protein